MTIHELEELDRQEQRLQNPREDRELVPIDRCSQLDTGYTGRQDNDSWEDPAGFREWYQQGRKDPRRI